MQRAAIQNFIRSVQRSKRQGETSILVTPTLKSRVHSSNAVEGIAAHHLNERTIPPRSSNMIISVGVQLIVGRVKESGDTGGFGG